ncbi:hypothetical protein SIN8267_00402 [Sinobacterium norvegicum]|uniref:DUF4279 domain-containing protein n=1 Tax=Sinobacterium norvegicum TaxID=1641715 RepID=A0ABM9AAS6_9GAMM|nr:DUF4279 domain-containing protein [Sinobacterium norvegicum]CAH0990310.1 hypothetical protein SIN8267_00402 [Sinobacterium norvegicum]
MSVRKPPNIDRGKHCLRTYATLRIYPQGISADEVTTALATQPTKIWRVLSGKPFDGWFLTTKGIVNSVDTTSHISYLLNLLEANTAFVELLLGAGSTVNIINFWHSDGQGGPGLNCDLIRRMARLGIEIDWNVYQQA